MKKYYTASEIWLEIVLKITKMQINLNKGSPKIAIKIAEILWPKVKFKKMDRGYYEVNWL